MTEDVLVAVAMIAYKENDKITTSSAGLEWLRKPLTRVVQVLYPHIVNQERLRIETEIKAALDSVGENIEEMGRDWCEGMTFGLLGTLKVVGQGYEQPQQATIGTTP